MAPKTGTGFSCFLKIFYTVPKNRFLKNRALASTRGPKTHAGAQLWCVFSASFCEGAQVDFWMVSGEKIALKRLSVAQNQASQCSEKGTQKGTTQKSRAFSLSPWYHQWCPAGPQLVPKWARGLKSSTVAQFSEVVARNR